MAIFKKEKEVDLTASLDKLTDKLDQLLDTMNRLEGFIKHRL